MTVWCIGVHGVANRPSYRHFRGNLQHYERRASFNYDDGIRAKYSRRLWGRSFWEIGHYMPPNYFCTWYLNTRDIGTHTRVCHTAYRPGSAGCRNTEMPSRAQNTKLHPAMEIRRILFCLFIAIDFMSVPEYQWNVYEMTSFIYKLNILQA